MALAQEILLDGDPFFNFINSLKSDSTKEGYRNALLRFMQQFHIKDTNTFSQLLPKDIESYLKNYIQFLKEEKRSTQSMNMILSAVNHFCVMNDIVINYKKICKFKSSCRCIKRISSNWPKIWQVADKSANCLCEWTDPRQESN